MGLPPSFLLTFHWTNIEVEDVASTDTMVGGEGANVCVMVGKYMMGNFDQMSKFGT